MRQAIIVVALAGALASCSDESSGPTAPPPPGCDLGSTCYSDPTATPASCSADFGTWLPGGCPTGTDRVGMCVTAGRITHYYSSNFLFFATNDAKTQCDLAGGTFVPLGMRTSASCELRPTFPVCIDGTGTESDVTQASFSCGFMGGTLGTSACSTSGRTGTCSYVDAGVQVNERHYAATTAVAAGCTGPGDTWTPG